MKSIQLMLQYSIGKIIKTPLHELKKLQLNILNFGNFPLLGKINSFFGELLGILNFKNFYLIHYRKI